MHYTYISQIWKYVFYNFHNRIDIRRRYGQYSEKQTFRYAISRTRVRAIKIHITILIDGVNRSTVRVVSVIQSVIALHNNQIHFSV